MMCEVKRMEKVTVTIMEPYADGNGYHEVQIEKNAWKCLACGLVWNMRHEAVNCKGRDHIPTYSRIYGGFYNNGVRIGGHKTIFSALRKEEPLTENIPKGL